MERGRRTTDVPFHVPGHKRGGGAPPGLHTLLGPALAHDLTELDGEIDMKGEWRQCRRCCCARLTDPRLPAFFDRRLAGQSCPPLIAPHLAPLYSLPGLDVLSTPSGPIAAAQAAAAATWGADASWMLVNGTTGGIHAAVMATCGPGTALLLPRNAHLSAFNACVLAGCTPVWVQPCYDVSLGVAHHVTPAALAAGFEAAAAAGLRVGAALLVSPTYFGVLSDVAGGWVRAAGCGRLGGTGGRGALAVHTLPAG